MLADDVGGVLQAWLFVSTLLILHMNVEALSLTGMMQWSRLNPMTITPAGYTKPLVTKTRATTMQ